MTQRFPFLLDCTSEPQGSHVHDFFVAHIIIQQSPYKTNANIIQSYYKSEGKTIKTEKNNIR